MSKTRPVTGPSNPAFLKDTAGHSVDPTAGNESLELPTDHEAPVAGDHAQFDDPINGETGLDPNLTGPGKTLEPLYTWMAGPLTAWQENDDYRKFGPGQIGEGNVAESATTHRFDRLHDGDYDDNGGHPLAEGHHMGEFGGASSHPADHQLLGTNALILRRL